MKTLLQLLLSTVFLTLFATAIFSTPYITHLKPGNKWMYIVADNFGVVDTIYLWVTDKYEYFDTIKYSIVPELTISTSRIDTGLYRETEKGVFSFPVKVGWPEYIFFNRNIPPDSGWVYPGYSEMIVTDRFSTISFGNPDTLTIIRYDFPLVGWTRYFSDLVGVKYFFQSESPEKVQLAGCVIDGKAYGQEFEIPVGVEENRLSPDKLILNAYPNPFNPMTNLSFDLQSAGYIRLVIYDLSGKEVNILEQGFLPKGTHRYNFLGTFLASGIYLARLETPSGSITRKLILIR